MASHVAGSTRRQRLFDRTPGELKLIIAAERAGSPFLLWRDAEGTQHIFALDSGNWRVTIGRDPDADVSLAGDAKVSRVHALLERVGHGWSLVDDGLSRNGSFVRGERVLGRRRLMDHDLLRFGATEITYREPDRIGLGPTASLGNLAPQMQLSPMQRKVLIALCRPVHDDEGAIPATNRQIAEEVFLSVDAVKAHLRALFERYDLSGLPQNEKRRRLVSTVLVSGVLDPREF